jgi:hypothetical protein
METVKPDAPATADKLAQASKLRERLDAQNFRIGGDGWTPGQHHAEEERVLTWVRSLIAEQRLEEAKLWQEHGNEIGEYGEGPDWDEERIAALKAQVGK